MPEFFWDGAANILKTAINAPLLYGAIILFVRLSGKRSTSQMNNFDWIVTVAMGSLVASGLIIDDVSLAESVFAIFALMALQYAFTWAAWHQPKVEHLLKAEPRLLLADGELLRDSMRKERVTEAELLAALREHGIYRLEDARWVVLESDASMSVIARPDRQGDPTAMQNVPGLGHPAK